MIKLTNNVRNISWRLIIYLAITFLNHDLQTLSVAQNIRDLESTICYTVQYSFLEERKKNPAAQIVELVEESTDMQNLFPGSLKERAEQPKEVLQFFDFSQFRRFQL